MIWKKLTGVSRKLSIGKFIWKKIVGKKLKNLLKIEQKVANLEMQYLGYFSSYRVLRIIILRSITSALFFVKQWLYLNSFFACVFECIFVKNNFFHFVLYDIDRKFNYLQLLYGYVYEIMHSFEQNKKTEMTTNTLWSQKCTTKFRSTLWFWGLTARKEK